MRSFLFTPFLFLTLPVIAGNENYYVKETPAGIELITPYGKKVILGDYAPDGGFNYHIEIPLNELKPSPTPTPVANAPTQPQLPTIIQTLYPSPVPVPGQEPKKEEKKEAEEKREPASVPPKILVQYDETDRMVLEANRLYNKKKFYDSTQVVEEILRRRPDYTRAWIMKGSLMYAQKQNDLAKKAWTQALVLEPENIEVKSLMDKIK